MTGTLSKPRAVVEGMLKKAGAKVTGSVSAMTNFLIVGADAGSKLAAAVQLGVQTITEAQLPDLLKGKTPSKQAASSDSESDEEEESDSDDE